MKEIKLRKKTALEVLREDVTYFGEIARIKLLIGESKEKKSEAEIPGIMKDLSVAIHDFSEKIGLQKKGAHELHKAICTFEKEVVDPAELEIARQKKVLADVLAKKELEAKKLQERLDRVAAKKTDKERVALQSEAERLESEGKIEQANEMRARAEATYHAAPVIVAESVSGISTTTRKLIKITNKSAAIQFLLRERTLQHCVVIDESALLSAIRGLIGPGLMFSPGVEVHGITAEIKKEVRRS